jgi:Uma2 family endonuclease
MSLPQPGHSGYTQMEYAQWEGRWELIHGEAHAMTPSPNLNHQRLRGQIGVALVQALEGQPKRSDGIPEVFFVPLDVYLAPDTVVQPDLLVVCDPAKISERGIEGVPDLVVEILSPGTASRDLTTKRWLYEAAGVKEYLVLDLEQELALLFVLEEGRYLEALRLTGKGKVPLLAGALEIDLSWPM